MLKKCWKIILFIVVMLSILGCSKKEVKADERTQIETTSKTIQNSNDEYCDYVFGYLDGNILHITKKEIQGKTIKCESHWYSTPLYADAIILSDYFGKFFVHKIVIDDLIMVESASYMFYGLFELEEIENVSNIFTRNMSHMFDGCSNLSMLNVNKLNVSNVKDTSYMFNGCKNLQQLDMTKWDVSKVTDMSYMFGNCESLQKLDIDEWDACKVTDMSYMFEECKKLKNLNLSKWNVSNVVDMRFMFDNCENIEYLDLSKWDVSNVKSMTMMFFGCNNLRNIDISNWNICDYKIAKGMFTFCDESIMPDWYKSTSKENNDDKKILPERNIPYGEEWKNIPLV